jgi:Ca2+-binding RTX toxin-like protein
MNADGSGQTQLTRRNPRSADVLPDWGPRPSATARADVLHGTAGPNTLCGRGGGDTLLGLGGNDTLFGERRGARGAASGDAGAAATAKGDRLLGGAGNDKLYAGAGGDRLDGGPGRDLLHGGGGDVVMADARDRLLGCEGTGRG